MGDDKKWMYDSWRKNRAHSREWVDKTNNFIKHAFSISNTRIVRCPCSKCQNGLSHDKKKVSIHICQFSYMPGYEVWAHHGEEVPENELVAEDAVTDEDRMDKMLNAICPKFKVDFEDPPTPEVQKFFELLKASEEAMHEHTTMYVLSFVTRLIVIKSKFVFSNNCYKVLLKLFSDVLLANHKVPRDMYQSKIGVVVRAVDDEGRETNYHGVIKDILKLTFGGDKDLRVFFSYCDWFDPTSWHSSEQV
jgi:hypothetical protein